jgi:hypothetical protein
LRVHVWSRRRSGENWPQFSGGEGVQLAEAVGKLGRGYAALAAEGAEKIFSCGFSFLGVALGAARNEVAVGILSSAGQGDDMVEAAGARGEVGQTVETEAAVAGMNGRAARFREQEIRLLDAGGAGPAGEARGHRPIGRSCVNLAGQEDIDHVAGVGAFDETQSALVNEGAHGLARGGGGEANAAGEPKNGKAKLELPFKAGMAHEMVIDRALGEIEAQARHKNIFELFPDEDSVGFVVFHSYVPDVAEGRFRAFGVPVHPLELGMREFAPSGMPGNESALQLFVFGEKE